MAPSEEHQKYIASAFEPLMEYQKQITSAFEPFMEYQKKLHKTLDKLSALSNEMPKNTRNAISLLAEKGWFVYFDLQTISAQKLMEITTEISNQKFTDDMLMESLEGRFEEIKESITAEFPKRKPIIIQALKAHTRGDYYLSIPVLLAQTDGICYEKTEKYLFRGEKPSTATCVNEKIAGDALMEAILLPLAEKTSINMNEKDRKENTNFDPNILNRHMILHGESLDYGTKENSFKALSLLYYVSQALSENT